MPNTCRTDTFMSGIPAGSSIRVMAAVVINPPWSRSIPKPDLRRGLRMWAWIQTSREQRQAEARPPIKVPLPFHLDRPETQFLEGCPAESAAFSPVMEITERPGAPWHFPDSCAVVV